MFSRYTSLEVMRVEKWTWTGEEKRRTKGMECCAVLGGKRKRRDVKGLKKGRGVAVNL